MPLAHPKPSRTWPWAPGTERGIGLYVHIPFCETKCPYCDFNTYSGIEALIPTYMAALRAETARWGDLLGHPRVRTVFFGGGTPSYVPGAEMTAIIAAYQSAFDVMQDAEVTLEANPGDVTVEKLATWLKAGVNRLSMGVQSFDDALLKMLGRRHTAQQAEIAYGMAREAGFTNMSLDLMFGLPEQTLAQWQESVERVVSLGSEHLSLYGLQLEHGTPLEAAVRTGRLPEPDQDLAADMYQFAVERLAAAGYLGYEISNWAKPGLESRHNLMYWRCESYLGLGPGAHSSMFGVRFADIKSPRGYVAAVRGMAGARPESGPPLTGRDIVFEMKAHGPVDFIEETTEPMARAEFLMMGLRLAEGIQESDFRTRFGAGLNESFAGVISGLTDDGLLKSDQQGIRLTPRGRLLGNEAFRRFVEAAEAAPPTDARI
ncbi:MAG: radical SAM family heme chaperone HemW [Dehalococcoidia bacterium]|nr:radical SAM family heme chaperone HemW [Dehalococcoidia bacterium]